jgi:hypothetical protein
MSRPVPRLRLGRLKAHDWFTIGSILAGFIGFGLTWRDVRRAIRRLDNYLSEGRKVFASASVTARVTVDAAGVVTGREPTLEERVKSSEVAISALHDEIRTGDEQVAQTLASRISQAATDVQLTVRGEIESLRAFVVDGWPKGIWAYRGPALVVISLLLAALGEVASLSQN